MIAKSVRLQPDAVASPRIGPCQLQESGSARPDASGEGLWIAEEHGGFRPEIPETIIFVVYQDGVGTPISKSLRRL